MADLVAASWTFATILCVLKNWLPRNSTSPTAPAAQNALRLLTNT
jgi:hypothetical protein